MKNLFSAIIAITVFTLVGCSASSKATQGEVSNPEPEKTKTYKVGDHAFGGIIFVINEEGTHGLVCASQDQFANASYTECTDMMNNPLYHDKEGKVYFDWRLPKVWEAYQMYMALHLVNKGDFSTSGYWTSQGPSSFDKISVVNFSNGLEFTSLKSDTYRSRAVRAF